MNIYSMLNCSSLLFLYSKSNKKYASLFHREIYLVIACPSIITGGNHRGEITGGNYRGGNLRGGNHLDPTVSAPNVVKNNDNIKN